MGNDRELRVRVDDIGPAGKDLEFQLNREALNERLALVHGDKQKNHVQPPAYVFSSAPEVTFHIDLEGSTLVIHGQVRGTFSTTCARCAEDTMQELDIPLELVLKPQSEGSAVPGAEDEDLHFGVYDGETVECMSIAEEFLVLALPFSVVCRENCKGLCSTCGKNLNSGACGCQPEEQGDPRLSVLRQLKLVH